MDYKSFCNSPNARYALNPDFASQKYTSIDQLLEQLNNVFGTNLPMSYSGLADALKHLINEKHDFGAAYARIRSVWPFPLQDETHRNLYSGILDMDQRKKDHETARELSTQKGRTVRDAKSITPRRIWDLYAHRVIPYEFSNLDLSFTPDPSIASYLEDVIPGVPEKLPLPSFFGYRIRFAVSHSWVQNPKFITTDVNAGEWPVPLPDDTTLEEVRNGLLALGAEYVWLDILCLRQQADKADREALRVKEWAIDVPTIGFIYQKAHYIVRYFNGLGREFSPRGWKDERHWTQRAWTLQEICRKPMINAGDDLARPILDRAAEDIEDLPRLKLRHIDHSTINVGSDYNIVKFPSLMAKKYASNPVDRIAGLAVLMDCVSLPVYLEKESEEDAWVRLLDHLPTNKREFMAFQYPIIGDGCCFWHPSWAQVMGKKLGKAPSHSPFRGLAVVMEQCKVSPVGHGAYTIERLGHSFKAAAVLGTETAVDEGEYTVIGSVDERCWCLCREHGVGYRKLAALSSVDPREVVQEFAAACKRCEVILI